MDRRLLRLALLAVFAVGLLLIAHLTGLTASFSTAKLRALIQSAGAWGVLLFIAAFAIGELLHIPGLMFVAAAVLAYGRLRGGVLSFVAALLSVSVNFLLIRAVGGQPLATIRNQRVRAILAHLDARPILTVALVRLVTVLTSAVTYVLALSSVGFGDYFIGSALGLAIPLTVAVALFGVFFH